MTEPQAEYVTKTVTDGDGERQRFYHDCGYFVGYEVDGVLVRKGDIHYSILMVCPDCRTLITWKADRLKSLVKKWRKEYHGLLEELDVEKLVVESVE